MSKGYLGELYAELNLKTEKLHDGSKKANKTIAKLERDIESIQERINSKLAMIGGALTIGVTAPLSIMGKQAIDTFANFEQSMQNTASVMSANASEMEALRKTAEEMGATTRFSASQASEALYHLGSSGQNVTQSIKSLDGVLRLAGATGSDLAFTSQTMTSTLSQFNLEADKSSHVADVFAMAISKSPANMTKLAYSMKYVGPVAKGLNVSLETTTAALMRLYKGGFGGEQAGTILRAGLQKLASGSSDLRAKLEEVGLTYDEINPKTNDLADILDKLKNANIDVAKASKLFGAEAAAGMSTLIESGGEAIRTMDGLLVASDGTAKSMQEIQNASFANTRAEMASAFEAVQITLAGNVMPVVDSVAQMFIKVLKVVNDLPVGVQTTATALGAFAAAVGPLMLLVLGVKKLKREMRMLNVTMLHNPIFIAGAVIAAVSAAALGAIAQMKKAHDDWVHGAVRGVEEVKRLKDKALEEGNKGRKIKSLFDEYNELKNKTQKTADEQERYNSLLQELQTLVPGVITELDNQKQAYIANAEAVTKAMNDQLEAEKTWNESAMILAKERVAQAKDVADEYEKKLEPIKKRISWLTKELGSGGNFTALENKIAKYQNAYKSGDTSKAENIKKEIQKLISDLELKKNINWNQYYSNDVKNAELFIKTQKSLLEKNMQLAEKYTAIVKEQAKAQKDYADLEKRNKDIEKKQTEIKEPKKTRKQHVNSSMEEYELQKKQIALEKKKADAKKEEFDDIGKRLQFLRKEYDKLLALTSAEVSDGQFVVDSKELKAVTNEIARLDAIQKARNNRGSKKTSSDEDNSLRGELKRLDDKYKKKIELAKELNQSTKKLEEKWRQERINKLNAFVDKEAKIKIGNAAKTEKEIEKIKEDIRKQETAKGSGVTVGNEYTRTNLMGLDFLGKFLEQTKATKRELAETENEIKRTQDLIAEVENGSYKGKEPIDKEQALKVVDGLKEKAQDLKKELGESSLSINEIDAGLSEIARIGESKYQIQLIDIDAEKQKLLTVVDEAEKAGKITEEQAKKARKKINKDSKKQARDAAAQTAQPYIDMALSIADTLTDIIVEGIEKGTVSSQSILQGTSGALNAVSNIVPSVTGKLVLGTLSAGLNIVGKFAGVMDRQREKEIAEAKKRWEEQEQQFQTDIEKRAGGIAKVLGNTIGSVKKHGLSVDSIFDEQMLQMEKKKIDNFLNDIDNIKTDKKRYVKRTARVKKGFWGRVGAFFSGGSRYETIDTSYYADKTVKELYKDLEEAIQKGDTAKEKDLKDSIQKAIEKAAKSAGIDLEKSRALMTFAGDFNSIIANYIQTKDKGALQAAIKNQLKKAIVDKTVSSIMNSKLKRLFNDYENAEDKDEALRKIIAEGEKTAEEASKLAEKIAGSLDLGKDEVEAQKESWKSLGKSITESLSSSLADAAYNADWGSFKKAFAGEMKKAIIQSTIASAGLKQQVDTIIKNIMEDGQITGEEVNSSIDSMQGVFDSMEDKFSNLAKITKALEGGVEVQSKNSGTIIQQLSGSDRDWFMEVFKDGFSKINKSIELNELTVQQIQATQIIIQSMTFNSYGGVHIVANENVDLKEMLTEVVQEAMAD